MSEPTNSVIVYGKVRGLGRRYSDGVERQEVHVSGAQASGLPYVLDQRLSIALSVGGEIYDAGLSATESNKYVWINPDLYREGTKVRLADVLRQAGFLKNQEVKMTVDGLRIGISPPSA